jgi:hypothetical protein
MVVKEQPREGTRGRNLKTKKGVGKPSHLKREEQEVMMLFLSISTELTRK